MRTLHEIITKADTGEALTKIEEAIVCAYYAGRSRMRGEITEAMADRIETLPESRYRHLVYESANHMIRNVSGINYNYVVTGRGDSGKDEADEILGYEFDL